MSLTHLVSGSIAPEIPGHTIVLGQILSPMIRLSRTPIGLPPNLEYTPPKLEKNIYAFITAMVINGVNDSVTRLGGGRWPGSV
jgi:hypothetical protein